MEQLFAEQVANVKGVAVAVASVVVIHGLIYRGVVNEIGKFADVVVLPLTVTIPPWPPLTWGHAPTASQ